MRRVLSFVVLVLLALAVSPVSAQSIGVSASVSPNAGLPISISHSNAKTNKVDLSGSAYEASVFKDLGSKGEFGLTASRQTLMGSAFTAVEGYAFIPTARSGRTEFGPLVGFGPGFGKDGVRPAFRAEMTVARTVGNTKLKGGVGMRYGRFSYTLSAGRLF